MSAGAFNERVYSRTRPSCFDTVYTPSQSCARLQKPSSLPFKTSSVIAHPTSSSLLVGWDASNGIDEARDWIPLVVTLALGLGIAANAWISRLLNGSQDPTNKRSGKRSGLSAFLKDGSGYKKSGFLWSDTDRAVSSDPLPWLVLPRLDFVEVAGQRKSMEAIMDEMEQLKADLNAAVAKEDIAEATRLKQELETRMANNGLHFNPSRDT